MAPRRVSLRLATVTLAVALTFGVVALPAQAALRHIDGTVLSKDASTKTFRIETQGGGKLRIKVTSATTFQRIAGFGGLRHGLAVEVEARSTDNGLVAVKVETRGGGGGGHGGADDGPNHT